MIYPNETELVGTWIIDQGTIREDETSRRINNLTINYLQNISVDDSGWYKLYRDPNDGRYWELSYPNSDIEGGGPPLLKCLSKDDALKRYQF